MKAAFDLYLPALAKQMGYQLPKQDLERQAFWDEVNSLFLYRAPIEAARWAESDFVPSPAGASGSAESGKEDEDKGEDDEGEGD